MADELPDASDVSDAGDFGDSADFDSDSGDQNGSQLTVFRPVSDVARDHIRLQALHTGNGNPLNPSAGQNFASDDDSDAENWS